MSVIDFINRIQRIQQQQKEFHRDSTQTGFLGLAE